MRTSMEGFLVQDEACKLIAISNYNCLNLMEMYCLIRNQCVNVNVLDFLGA